MMRVPESDRALILRALADAAAYRDRRAISTGTTGSDDDRDLAAAYRALHARWTAGYAAGGQR